MDYRNSPVNSLVGSHVETRVYCASCGEQRCKVCFPYRCNKCYDVHDSGPAVKIYTSSKSEPIVGTLGEGRPAFKD